MKVEIVDIKGKSHREKQHAVNRALRKLSDYWIVNLAIGYDCVMIMYTKREGE